MITLFRRIRQKLIASGSITKYLLYALGEILLVVIGILIALQINNWNNDRIERGLELKLLTQIQSDLLTTAESITDLQSKLEVSVSSADSLLQSFREKEEVKSFVFNASLIHRRFFFNPASSGYSQLGGSLGTVIRNDSLRNQIVDLYEGDFEEIGKRQEMLTGHLNQNVVPQSSKLFDLNRRISFRMSDFDENSMDIYTPINFETLASDGEYANTIVILKRLYSIQLNQLRVSLNQIEGTVAVIEDEIDQFDN